MMFVNLLILALLGAWMLQITLAIGTAIYLIVRSITQRNEAALPVLRSGTA